MGKNKFVIAIIIVVIVLIIGIGFKVLSSKNDYSHETSKDNEVEEDLMVKEIEVIINNKNYSLVLEDNETTRKLVESLPLNIEMNELNGNEKYVYMDIEYPTNSMNPKHINKGDVMLYGNNCLVIFYKSFDTSYSYTRIGHIENLEDLGNDSIEVRIEK